MHCLWGTKEDKQTTPKTFLTFFFPSLPGFSARISSWEGLRRFSEANLRHFCSPVHACLSEKTVTHQFWIFNSLSHSLPIESWFFFSSFLHHLQLSQKPWAHSSKGFSLSLKIYVAIAGLIDFSLPLLRQSLPPTRTKPSMSYRVFGMWVSSCLCTYWGREESRDYSRGISTLLNTISEEWQERHKLTMPQVKKHTAVL